MHSPCSSNQEEAPSAGGDGVQQSNDSSLSINDSSSGVPSTGQGSHKDDFGQGLHGLPYMIAISDAFDPHRYVLGPGCVHERVVTSGPVEDDGSAARLHFTRSEGKQARGR